MAKVTGFNNSYSGLKENEAWQRIYEFGKNLMPIKEHILQKKYNKIFNKKTKVIRDNIICKVSTDRLVPGDIIILEKGDFIPVDGRILEESSLEFYKEFSPEEDKFKNDANEKIVYQGMRVKKGKAVIEAIRTGDTTYFGGLVKEVDNKKACESNFERVIQIYFNIIGCAGIVLLLFGAIFSFATGEGDIISRLSVAGYSGLLLFLVTLPLGAILVLIIKFIEQKRIIRKSNLIIKKYSTLLKAYKTTVVCIDDKFLGGNYEKYIQRFYSAGIMVAVISPKGEAELKELAKNAGIFEDNVETISGKELDNMEGEQLYQTICNTVIFYEVNSRQKAKIIEGFSELNIKTIGIVNGVEDLPILRDANVGICTHHRKKNLEYEFADATIIGTEMTSIYSLIKGSCIIKNYMNHYMKYYIMFQFPIIISILVALLANLDLKVFYFQTLAFIVAIIPLLLILVNRDYSEEMLCELKKRDKNFVISCIEFAFIGFFMGIMIIGFYILLSYFEIQDVLKIGLITILLTVIDFLIILLSRKKFGRKTEKKVAEKVVKEEKKEEIKKEETKKEEAKEEEAKKGVGMNKVKKEKNKKTEKKKEIEKPAGKMKNEVLRKSKKSSIEDIKDEII